MAEIKQKKNRLVWNDGLYVKAYILAREGMTLEQIGANLGYSGRAMHITLKRKPYLKDAIDQGRKAHQSSDNLKDYIYGHLPPRAKQIWDQMQALDDHPSPYIRIQKLLKNKDDRFQQHLFIHALISKSFSPSDALYAVCIPYKKLKKWLKTDPGFVELMDEVMFHKKNFVEGALMKLIEAGDNASVIFANKTLNRDRGYSERQDVRIEHEVTHRHVVDIDQLKLSHEVKKAILIAMREKENEPLKLTDQRHPEDGIVDVEDADFEVKKESA